ncbi:MAG TPA: hypothetical protein VK026_09165 [Paenalcaligenes sp.]|nr:hypothetical protein [Paenalcaligenes sp.]
MRYIKRLAAVMVGLAISGGTVWASESWLQSQVSPRITQVNEPINYKIDPPAPWDTRSDAIQRVDVHLQYQSDATVLSQLCLASSYRCVTINGSSFTTDVFNGEPINSAFFLVHTVTRWNDADPNLYIRSSLAVWAGH